MKFVIDSQATDRLNVFISSTISECAAERAIARDAIRSINQEPILFEGVGSRPHPPRMLYKSRLESSHIVVFIYRCSYGWVAPDMEISGIHDEFNLAADRGMDRLVYILRTSEPRDPRLEELIESAKNSGITVSFYDNPDDLRERIRDDVTAAISSRFVDQSIEVPASISAAELLDSLIPEPNQRMRRPLIEKQVLDILNQAGRLVINAPFGMGKTILLAQLAIEHDWLFVDGRGLDRLELLVRTANALRSKLYQPALAFNTENSAKQALLKAWACLSGATLAIDSANDGQFLWDFLSNKNRLVLTTRINPQAPVRQRFELPALSIDEVKGWVTTLQGSHPGSFNLSLLFERSGGLPLFLRFYAQGEIPEIDLSLQNLEIRTFKSLAARPREIVSYLALTKKPLAMTDLLALIGTDNGSPEEVADCVSDASALIRQSRGVVELVHDHTRQTLRELLGQEPMRLGYFASRLGKYLEQIGEFLAAFMVYEDSGERLHADRLLKRASHQASLRGGGSPAIPVFRRAVEKAREIGSIEDEVMGLLALARALRQVGAADDAVQILDKAREIARASADRDILLGVEETELALGLDKQTMSERINALERLRKAYSEDGSVFNTARLSLLISAEYIGTSEFQLAEQAAQSAVDLFSQLGDEYGERVSRINLVVARSGIEDPYKSHSELWRKLEAGIEPSDFPRERAVICNLLTRRYRKAGQVELAVKLANEAIQIGERLGDRHIIAVNRINLGNLRRDEGLLDQALSEYQMADRLATEGAFPRDEAAANELIASILNEKGEFQLALFHAQHAASLARGAGDFYLVARAEQERAEAYLVKGEIESAIDAFISAANAISAVQSGGKFFQNLIGEALSTCATSGQIELKVDVLANVFAAHLKQSENKQDVDPLEVFYAALPEIVKRINVPQVAPIVALASADLFSKVPPLIERRIICKAIDDLLMKLPFSNSQLMGIAAILLSSSWERLSLSDLVSISERLSRSNSNLYFKPHSDGGAHWTIRMQFSHGVIVTLTQLDDSPRSAALSMILVLFLVGLNDVIRREVVDAESLARKEVMINVVGRTDFEANVSPDTFNIGELPSGFTVSESSDLTSSDQPPIVVIHENEFGKAWHPNKRRLSDVHVLFGHLLRSLTSHVLAKEIEPDVLVPKIGKLIRSIGFQGSVDTVTINTL
jgi:tetratricopeptide (TPR) repeat protein